MNDGKFSAFLITFVATWLALLAFVRMDDNTCPPTSPTSLTSTSGYVATDSSMVSLTTLVETGVVAVADPPVPTAYIVVAP